MSHNYYSLHYFVDHKIVDRPNLIDFWSHLVAFLEIWAHLGAFSVHYLNTLGNPINHLIDKAFNSHQEYTIASSLLAPARGTARPCNLLIFKHFTRSCLFYPPDLVTIGGLFWGLLLNTPSFVTKINYLCVID